MTIRLTHLAILAGLVCSARLDAAVRYVNVNSITPSPPYTNWAAAATIIQDAIDIALPGDEIVVTNGVYETGGRTVFGSMTNRVAVTRPLTLRSVNGPEMTVIRGYRVSGTTRGDAAVRAVYLTNGAALVGFTLTNGATLSNGVTHEEISGGGVWCESPGPVVSNCVLTGNSAAFGGGAFWGTLVHCQLIGNTAGSGGGAVRSTLNNCHLMGNSTSGRGTHYAGNVGGGAYYATLNGCLVSGNSAQNGGGVFGCTLTNSTLSDNTATEQGGGSRSSRLFNCILVGNTAGNVGGGACGGEINNCTIVNNAASGGGGVWSFSGHGLYGGGHACNLDSISPMPEAHGCLSAVATVINSTIHNNTASDESNHSGFTGEGYRNIEKVGGTLNYSCTWPMPPNSLGNITDDPLFMDAAVSNFRLQTNSPCINAGRNAYGPFDPDLDGNPRIVGGTVDIGAYEFQEPQSALSYAWLQQYGFPTDGSSDFTDADSDGHDNWQEWRTGTDPTNSLSALRLLAPIRDTNGIQVRWQSVSGQTYFVERGSNLGTTPVFAPVADTVVGQAGTTIITDTNAVGTSPFFYRVGVPE